MVFLYTIFESSFVSTLSGTEMWREVRYMEPFLKTQFLVVLKFCISILQTFFELIVDIFLTIAWSARFPRTFCRQSWPVCTRIFPPTITFLFLFAASVVLLLLNQIVSRYCFYACLKQLEIFQATIWPASSLNGLEILLRWIFCNISSSTVQHCLIASDLSRGGNMFRCWPSNPSFRPRTWYHSFSY